MIAYDPPPPYDSQAHSHGAKQPRLAPHISSLPLHLVHRIVSLTLDPHATPSRFSGDYEEEKVRRMWALFLGLRGVDRRFFLGERHLPGSRDTKPPRCRVILPVRMCLTRSIHIDTTHALSRNLPRAPTPGHLVRPLPHLLAAVLLHVPLPSGQPVPRRLSRLSLDPRPIARDSNIRPLHSHPPRPPPAPDRVCPVRAVRGPPRPVQAPPARSAHRRSAAQAPSTADHP